MQLTSHDRSSVNPSMPLMRGVTGEMEHRVLDHDNARRLWAAVLERAILDLQDRTTRADAITWIRSHRHGVGSFHWICQQLDMDPDSVRHALLGPLTATGATGFKPVDMAPGSLSTH
ncbi:hypothetical protein SIID45300_02038 [Candidatus Magnetaquicoccaceae bacterium FCR-1]|uniref:Uncharacterized protein n=1 Tax=Candidatus Magnetaquiglobus chichijimensis TaxID=3141448 RepID=A0ABQ0C9Y8_9PROT